MHYVRWSLKQLCDVYTITMDEKTEGKKWAEPCQMMMNKSPQQREEQEQKHTSWKAQGTLWTGSGHNGGRDGLMGNQMGRETTKGESETPQTKLKNLNSLLLAVESHKSFLRWASDQRCSGGKI